MKRSLFITASIGVAALATLPPVHRMTPRSDVVATRRLTFRAAGATPGRCHASHSVMRWSGFTLAAMLA